MRAMKAEMAVRAMKEVGTILITITALLFAFLPGSTHTEP